MNKAWCLALALASTVPSVALARTVNEPSGGLARSSALLVPMFAVPELPRSVLERAASGRPLAVRRVHLGDIDVYEGEYRVGTTVQVVRVSDDGQIVGRDSWDESALPR